MQWLASNISKDVFINIMEQYHPDAHVGKPRRHSSNPLSQEANSAAEHETSVAIGDRDVRYKDINRAILPEEVSSVRQAAENAGLWRFCDPPAHSGFNI
jgi:putative pyruvate formate lyase activating enzyme